MNDTTGELFTVSYYRRANLSWHLVILFDASSKNSAKRGIFPNMGSNYIAELTAQGCSGYKRFTRIQKKKRKKKPHYFLNERKKCKQ